jgi:CBS domain-containing protein
MNADVTVRDVMAHEFVGVSEGDDVRSTASLMLSEGVDCVVALRGQEPVGLLSEREVLRVVSAGEDPSEATVGSVMRDRGRSVEPDAGLDAALDIMTTEDTSRLLVDDGELHGLLTGHDLLSAAALERFEDSPVYDEVARNVSVRATARAAATDPEGATATFDPEKPADVEMSDQGICQECGALARDLVGVDGQVLCAYCRDV